MSLKTLRRTQLSLLGFPCILLILLANTGCPKQPGQDEFVEIERIQDTGNNERLEKFSSYPIDRQIDIYLFAQINLAGKRDTYFRYLADNGENKTREIARKIDSTGRASFKADLISVLDFIDQNCSCVHNNAQIMEILINNESKIIESDPNDAMSRDFYKKVLSRIKSRGTESSEP